MQRGRVTQDQLEALLALAAETVRRPLEWDPRELSRERGETSVERLGVEDDLIGFLIADPARLNRRIAEAFRAEAMDRLCSITAAAVGGDGAFLDAAEAVNREAGEYAGEAAFPEGLPTVRQKGEALLLLRYGGVWDPVALWRKVCPQSTLVTPRRLSEVLRDAGLATETDDPVPTFLGGSWPAD